MQPEDCWCQEPTLFYHCNGDLLEVGSCRLCLNFHPSTNMIAIRNMLEGKIVPSIVFEILNIHFKDDDLLLMICGECIARAEILHSIWAAFLAAEKDFTKLLATAQTSALEIHSKIVLEHPSVDAFIEETELCSIAEAENEQSLQLTLPPDEPFLRSPFKDTAVIAPKTITRFRNSTKSVALKAVVGRKCYICVTVFEDANELLQHLSEVHATNVGYHCKGCFSKFRQVIAYNRYLGRHETKERPNK
ncbi:uncharacterized protein LOC131681336 isoform X2 [Topomyia yanbarensis]|uniref:uncharacterized protein LOC131681336 isoform X2 n=1 Tax=Topomyia yanbarensis TaxID=2498891 RepID=UPI00273BBECA|nr:uncharacterized protein LOC131681336 isoform X2 [Topomyia yanbarensis]